MMLPLSSVTLAEPLEGGSKLGEYEWVHAMDSTADKLPKRYSA